MTTGRRGSWVALAALTALTLASAVVSLSTAPTHRAGSVAVARHRPATGAGPNGARFTVSPVTVVVGQSLHLTGTGCLPVFQAGVSIGANFSPADLAFVTAATDGSWTVVLTVGDATPLGTVDVTADCVERATHSTVFGYAAVPIHVRTFRHLNVLPGTTIDAGSVLDVSSDGSCPAGPSPYNAVIHLEKSPGNPTYGISALSGPLPSSGGEWSATLPVPAATPPGSYVLLADCEIRRAVVAYYSGVSITVRSR